jgi:hypothetical protein
VPRGFGPSCVSSITTLGSLIARGIAVANSEFASSMVMCAHQQRDPCCAIGIDLVESRRVRGAVTIQDAKILVMTKHADSGAGEWVQVFLGIHPAHPLKNACFYDRIHNINTNNRRSVYSEAMSMHTIDEIKRESVLHLLSSYTDVIRRVFVGHKEVVLQEKTRKDYRAHGDSLDSMLKSRGYLFMTHRKGDVQIAYSEVRYGLLYIDAR